jgi:hypothetical protein
VKPSVSRIVHYVSFGTPGGEYKSECRAAVVTEVGEVWVPEGHQPPEGTPVGLAVLNPSGMFFNRGVMQDEDGHQGGTWHWPEREPDGSPQVHVNVDPDASPVTVKRVTEMIQAALLQQAKRGRTTGIKLPGRG